MNIHFNNRAESHILKEIWKLIISLCQAHLQNMQEARCNTFPTVQLSPTACLSRGCGEVDVWKAQPDLRLGRQVREYRISDGCFDRCELWGRADLAFVCSFQVPSQTAGFTCHQTAQVVLTSKRSVGHGHCAP
jgi:hypothetical protein